MQHQRHSWLGGSPDGLVRSDGVVEFKCPWPKAKQMWTTDTIPLQYFVQCQVLMEVTQRGWCDLFAWTPSENRRWRFRRDKSFFNMICPALAQFHACMAAQTEPPPRPVNATKAQEAFVRRGLRECLMEPKQPLTTVFSEVDTTTWTNCTPPAHKEPKGQLKQ